MKNRKPLRHAFALPFRISREKNIPVIAGIYEPTGFGKTYTSAEVAIDEFLRDGFITIYTAPTRRLVHDYVTILQMAAARQCPDLYIYQLHSRESTKDDGFLTNDITAFSEATQKHILSDARRTRGGGDTQEDPLQVKIRRLPQHIRTYEMAKAQFLQDSADKRLADDMPKMRDRILNLANEICSHIVKHELETDYKKGLFYIPEIRRVLEYFTPMDLFIKDPGLIVATASKLATGASNYYMVVGRDGKKKARRNSHETFFNWFSDADYRFALLLDEEEESHHFLYAKLKKQLTNREVDLHRIVYAFFHYYDITCFASYAKNVSKDFGRKFFLAVPKILQSVKKLHDIFSQQQQFDGPTRTECCRALSCFDTFSTAELKMLVHDYFQKQNTEDGFEGLATKLRMANAIAVFLREMRKDRGLQETDSFDDYLQLVESLYDKKRILADKRLIRQFGDDFGYIFFNEHLEIYDHSVLSKIHIQPVIGGNNLELVTLDDANPGKSYTLREFLNFLMLLTRLLMQHKIPAATYSNKITDSQDTVLLRYKEKIGRWGIAKSTDDGRDTGEDSFCEDDDLFDKTDDVKRSLSQQYVFQGKKFVLSIVEDKPGYQEYAHDLCYVSIVGNVQTASPEEMMLQFLRVDDDSRPKNILIPMSATLRISQYWGTLNYRYMQLRMDPCYGIMIEPDADRMQAIAQFRERRLSLRNIQVKNFSRVDFSKKLSCTSLHALLQAEARNQLISEDGARRLRNQHKLDEVSYMLAMLGRLCTSDIRSAMVFSQRISFMVRVMEGMADRGLGFTRGSIPGLFHFDPNAFGVQSDRVTVIAYSSSFAKAAGSGIFIEGRFVPYTSMLDYTEESDEDVLDQLLDERKDKVFLLTAFQSASRGLTLTNKCDLEKGIPHPRYPGIGRKDFDVLMIAMSPYYDGLYRVPDLTTNQMERLQAMLHYLWDNNRLETTTFFDLPSIIKGEHVTAFHPEYLRFIGRGMIQTMGRPERVEGTPDNGAPNRQEIYINREVVVDLALFFKLVPDIEQRFSANNWQLYQHVKEFEKQTRMFAYEKSWDGYVQEEVEIADLFTRSSRSLYRGFRDPEKRKIWDAVRSSKMFVFTDEYLNDLRKLKARIPSWAGFIESLFLLRPIEEVHLKQIKSDSGGNKPTMVISDLFHASHGRYEPAQIMIPNALRYVPEFMMVMHRLQLNPELIFRQHLPRPKFFFDYAKPYFTELIFAELVKADSRLEMLDIASHKQAAILFEKYDHFVRRGRTIFAIDNKSWGRVADRKLSKKLQQNIARKLSAVESVLGRVEPLYINLYGDKPCNVEVIEGRLVRFYNIFEQYVDSDGVNRMVFNHQLFAFLHGDDN